MRILLKNGHVINPKTNFNEIADILIEDDKIIEIGKVEESADKVIDCTNLIISPGLIDMHVHLRDPGLTHKEDIETGVKSAVRGGITSVACMPNTNPVTDSKEVIEYILEKAKRANLANVYPIATITKGMEGREINDYATLKEAGAIAVSDDGKPVTNSKIMREALIEAYKVDMPVIEHGEDMYLGAGLITESEFSRANNLPGIPKEAEEIDIARQIVLARNNNVRVHIAHISTKGSVDMIRQAKKDGVQITCETCPHYFSLLVEDTKGNDTNAKMNPPLREKVDLDAIIEGLKDGTIDAIVTDHAPHSEEEKALGIQKAPNGIIGFETSLKAGITYLVEPGHITLNRLLELMTINPANILNINKGNLNSGEDADITVFEPHIKKEYTKESIVSKSKNSPYIGKTLSGEIYYTIVGGKIVYEGGASCQ